MFSNHEMKPHNYSKVPTARASKQGGSVSLIFNFTSTCDIKIDSFEFHLVVLYRPPGSDSQLLDEFGEFISDLVTHFDTILVIRDFNRPS